MIEENEENYTFEYYDKFFIISKNKISNLYDKYNQLNIDEELSIYNDNYYECLVEEHNPILMREDLVINDNSNRIVYNFGGLSDEYVIFLFESVFTNSIDYRRKLRSVNSSMSRRYAEEIDDLFDLLKTHLRRFITLKISTDSSFSINEYKTRADAVMFNISFNTGIAITQVKYIDEYFGRPRQGNTRSTFENIEAPKRKYISDLVYHYQMGLGTYHPTLKFISFYHVIEHFFQKVFYEELVNTVRSELTSPRFSVKRDGDINKLIKSIKNRIRLDNESNTAKNENEALLLTLVRYVDLEKLTTALNEMDSNLLDYYTNHNVEFSNGPKINFYQDDDKVYKEIARRIYKTRNAVIHSKSDDSERYIPFKHEGQLLKEIPLLQTIAEEIIISTSKLI